MVERQGFPGLRAARWPRWGRAASLEAQGRTVKSRLRRLTSAKTSLQTSWSLEELEMLHDKLIYCGIVLFAMVTAPGNAPAAAASAPAALEECVILLHGLSRTRRSMQRLNNTLARSGYKTVNQGYHSRSETIEVLADSVIPAAIAACRQQSATTMHFVTHSMGGIVLRYYLSRHEIAELGRVVMLSPPNQGSALVEKLGRVPGFGLLKGPAGKQLGTTPEGIVASLGPASFELGVITGNHSINPLLSAMLPGEDDGKVTVEEAKLEGMADFLVVPRSHTFISASEEAISQVVHFLANGRFAGTEPTRQVSVGQ